MRNDNETEEILPPKFLPIDIILLQHQENNTS